MSCSTYFNFYMFYAFWQYSISQINHLTFSFNKFYVSDIACEQITQASVITWYVLICIGPQSI